MQMEGGFTASQVVLEGSSASAAVQNVLDDDDVPSSDVPGEVLVYLDGARGRRPVTIGRDRHKVHRAVDSTLRSRSAMKMKQPFSKPTNIGSFPAKSSEICLPSSATRLLDSASVTVFSPYPLSFACPPTQL